MTEQKEPVAFLQKEAELAFFLRRYGERDPDRWLTLEQIAERLYPRTESKTRIEQTKTLLTTTKQKLERINIPVLQTTSQHTEAEVYGIPNNLSEEVSHTLLDAVQPEKKEAHFLYLGELGFGTKAFDHRALVGLAYFLRENTIGKKSMLDSLDAVILNGGLIPYVPKWYTVKTAQDMRLLDKRAKGTPEDEANERKELEHILEHVTWSEEMKEWYERHVAHKIISTQQAATTSRTYLEELLGENFKGELHYIYGEHDDAMIKELEETKITQLLAEQRKYEAERKKSEKKIKDLNKQQESYQRHLDILTQLSTWLDRAYVDTKGKSFEQAIQEFTEKESKKIYEANKLSKRLGHDIKKMLSNAKNRKDIRKRTSELRESYKDITENLDLVQKEKKTVEEHLAAQMRRIEGSGFFRFTKRVELRPDHAELVRKWASLEYRAFVRECYKSLRLYDEQEDYKSALHPEFRADIFVKGHHLLLSHFTGIRSNNTEKDSIAKLDEQLGFLNRRDFLIPDVYITAHGAQGMRIRMESKSKETIVPGEYRRTPEACMLIKLATFHSDKKLETLTRNKSTKTWEVKRFETNYASGAHVHTITQDGRHIMRFIPTEDLIYLGMKLEEYAKKQCSKKDLNDAFQIGDTLEVALATDWHLGAPSHPGRPSQYHYINAIKKYLDSRPHQPNILLMTEILHGDLKRAFASAHQQQKPLRYSIEESIMKIITDKTLDDKTRIGLLAQLNLLQDDQGSIPQIDKQYLLSDHYVLPIGQNIIKQGGIVVIPSGNHVNDTSRGNLDESLGLFRGFDKEEKKRVICFPRVESNFGLGEFKLALLGDTRKLYASHRMLKGTDDIEGMIKHVTKMKAKISSVYMGDVHHAAFGYADKTAFVVGAGLQSWNSFVDSVGLPASLRGLVLHRMSRSPHLPNYHEVEFILDKPIEQHMDKKQLDLEKKLITEYLPKNGV